MNNLDFEPQKLKAFLEEHFGERADMRIERIGGGQSNPTYYLDFGKRRMVLRKQPTGPILKGAHAIDREFRVIKALAETDVPVPHTITFEEGDDVIGTPFYLMDRLVGRVFHNASLPDLPADERHEVYMAMAETLARLHAIKPDEIGLGDYGRPGNYFKRQLARWSTQWEQAITADIPELDTLVEWLSAQLPPDDGCISIAHGDFRLGNLIFDPNKSKIIGILDWELSTLGHPLADLGYCCMPWRTTPDEYGGILGKDIKALGIPKKEEFVEHYLECGMLTPPLLPFHEVFALFRFSMIFVGISDRARIGNASGENAAELAPLARQFAVRALELAEAYGD